MFRAFRVSQVSLQGDRIHRTGGTMSIQHCVHLFTVGTVVSRSMCIGFAVQLPITWWKWSRAEDVSDVCLQNESVTRVPFDFGQIPGRTFSRCRGWNSKRFFSAFTCSSPSSVVLATDRRLVRHVYESSSSYGHRSSMRGQRAADKLL